jgi:hypothetical protein
LTEEHRQLEDQNVPQLEQIEEQQAVLREKIAAAQGALSWEHKPLTGWLCRRMGYDSSLMAKARSAV